MNNEFWSKQSRVLIIKMAQKICSKASQEKHVRCPKFLKQKRNLA